MNSRTDQFAKEMMDNIENDIAELRALLIHADPVEAEIVRDMLRINHELSDSLHHILAIGQEGNTHSQRSGLPGTVSAAT